jgi:hypothetical protein
VETGNGFELRSKGTENKSYAVTKKRVLVGSSQACDVFIPDASIAAIHAVVEINGSSARIFDMHSPSGTLLNGKKIVVENLSAGDVVRLGQCEFIFGAIDNKNAPQTPLTILGPKAKPYKPQVDGLPRVEYPLAKDPKAEFSEYIFEDVELLYPIFQYQVDKGAVEIIILFKGRIYSVDYLPLKDGVYRLAGSRPSTSDIEYAYLGKNEKIDFVEVSGHQVSVHALQGYEFFALSDSEPAGSQLVRVLGPQDIFHFRNGDIQVFVRSTESPPVVAAAPIFRRDGDLKKYLILVLLLLFAILGPLAFFEVDKEIEQEKAPERIATILYKRKLTVSKEKAIEKTKDAPKEVIQKSPQLQKNEEKPKESQMQQEKPADKPATATGDTKAVVVADVKKAAPNKGPRDVVKPKVKPSQNKGESAATPAQRRPKTATSKNINNKGPVDAYKSADFKSTISSLMAKGGDTKATEAVAASDGDVSSTSLSQGEAGATLKSADVSKNIGSLTGATTGKLDTSKGASGLVEKTNIYTAGLPFKTVVLGGMDPDIIRQILIDHLPQFRYCYQKELDRAKSSFNGVVRLNFIIGASGHVTKAGVDTLSSLPNEVKGCVVNVLRGIKFPEPMGGGVVEVNQPMNFYPTVK